MILKAVGVRFIARNPQQNEIDCIKSAFGVLFHFYFNLQCLPYPTHPDLLRRPEAGLGFLNNKEVIFLNQTKESSTIFNFNFQCFAYPTHPTSFVGHLLLRREGKQVLDFLNNKEVISFEPDFRVSNNFSFLF